jgi:YD repeat-containing protein
MTTAVTETADPQYGLQTQLASTVVGTPGGKQMTVASSASVTLDGAKNLVSRVDTTTINSKNFTRTYNAAARTVTSVSPVGRQTVTTLDDKGRVAQTQSGTLAPTAYAYDSRGRLASVTTGSGTSGVLPASVREIAVAQGVACHPKWRMAHARKREIRGPEGDGGVPLALRPNVCRLLHNGDQSCYR